MSEEKFFVTQNEWDAIVDFLNKYREEQKQKEWPQFNDTYYYIDGFYVDSNNYNDDDIDKGLKAIGNFFKTEEEAQFKLEQIKVLHELEELADDDQEWNGRDNCLHYYLEYSYYNNKLETDWNNNYCKGTFYFKSVESAEAAIKQIGEYRLKKYYFLVPEDKIC